jgi:hypothetical protein
MTAMNAILTYVFPSISVTLGGSLGAMLAAYNANVTFNTAITIGFWRRLDIGSEYTILGEKMGVKNMNKDPVIVLGIVVVVIVVLGLGLWFWRQPSEKFTQSEELKIKDLQSRGLVGENPTPVQKQMALRVYT